MGYLTRQSGKYQWDCTFRGVFKPPGRSSHPGRRPILLTVFCDDIDDARAAAQHVAEQMGYTEITVDKIVKRGHTGTLHIERKP